MLKKILSVLLTAAMLIAVAGIIPASAADADDLAPTGGGPSFSCGDYGYGLDDDGNALIYDYTGSEAELIVPSELDGHVVTSISWFAFEHAKSFLTSVTIPETVVTIDGYAFEGCTSLETVVFPQSLKEIGENAFKDCETLMELDIPASVKVVGKDAFENTLWYSLQPNGIVYAGRVAYAYKGSVPATVTIKSGTVAIAGGLFEDEDDLVTVNVPDSVESIGTDAFKYCKSLKSFKFPSSLTYLGTSAFEECDSLTSVSLPAALSEIGERVFHYCDKLTTLTVDPANPVFDSRSGCNAIIRKADNKLLMAIKTSAVPNGVEIIGRDAFMSNYDITSLDLPDSVRVIEGQAFWGCSNLETVKFPSKLVEIGDRAFAYCYELDNISLPATVKHLAGNSFESTAWERSQPVGMIYFGSVAYRYYYEDRDDMPSQITLKNGTKYIAEGAFEDLDTLNSVSLPSTLSEIGASAFNDCDALLSVSVPEGVTRIGGSAFSNCPLLSSANIPSSASDIGDDIFSNDSQLKFVTLGNGIKKISNYMFYGCTALETVEIPDTVTEIGWCAFYNCQALLSMTVPDSVTKIEGYAFEKCSELKTLRLGTNLTDVADTAFTDCDFTYVFISDINTFWNVLYAKSDLEIKYLYLNNKLLTELTVPADITKLADNAFNGKNTANWKKITLSSGVTSIGKNAFKGCEKLESLTLPVTLLTIGSEAFADCDALKQITVPDSVTSIGSGAFSYCDSLESAVIGASADFENDILKSCPKLVSITVSSKNKRYDSRGNCNAVIRKSDNTLYLGCKASYIPETVTAIGDSAFENCSALTQIRIPSSVKTIGEEAFEGSGLTKIVIPESVTAIGSRAFNLCPDLKQYAIGNRSVSLTDSKIGRYNYWTQTWIGNTLHLELKEGCYDGVTVYGYAGSTANVYAVNNGFTFDKWENRPSEPPAVMTACLGDANGDGETDAVDATVVQRYATHIAVPYDEAQLMNADVDGDGILTIVDATFIQRYDTRTRTPYPIGEPIG